MDAVAKKIKEIAYDGAGADVLFVERFAQTFLEKRGYVDGPLYGRRIQPLFGWLLMESHDIDKNARIKVAPELSVAPTANPLLIELGRAVFKLHIQLKDPKDLGAVIDAYAEVQRLSQDTKMRMVVRAQIMASVTKWKIDGVEKEHAIYYGGFYPKPKAELHPKLQTLGFSSTDVRSSRATLVLSQVATAVHEEKSPFVALATDYKEKTVKYGLSTSVNPGPEAQKIKRDLSNDGADAGDYVTVEVDWQ